MKQTHSRMLTTRRRKQAAAKQLVREAKQGTKAGKPAVKAKAAAKATA